MFKLFTILAIFISFSAPAHQTLPANPYADFAIVLIDMQDGFLYSDSSRNDFSTKREAMIVTQVELIRWARQKDIPVLVFEYDGSGSTIWPIDQEIRMLRDFRFVGKSQNGGFSGWRKPTSDPQWILKNWGIKNLIVTGINGPYCVYSTVVGALEHGFNVFTANGLVGDFSRTSSVIYPDCSWTKLLRPFPVEEHWLTGRRPLFRNFSDVDAMLSCEDRLVLRRW